MNGRIEDQMSIYNSIETEITIYSKFIRDWYFYLKANDISATTCRDYIRKVKKFLAFNNLDIINMSPSDIKKTDIVNYFNSIQTKEIIKDNKKTIERTSDSYKQGIWSCLNNLFEYLYSQGLIPENYIKTSKIKRPQNNDLQRINKNRILLTADDFKKIIKAVETGVGSSGALKYQRRLRNRDMSIMLLFMTTGMRRNALREINIEDVDLDNKKITVIDKGYKIHEYALTDTLVEYLRKWLVERYFVMGGLDNDALFVSLNRQRITGTAIYNLIDKYACAALGYHISPHKLRSGLASIIYNEKHDLEYVRRVIGHSNITTTQRYVVTDNKEREEAADYVCGFLH